MSGTGKEERITMAKKAKKGSKVCMSKYTHKRVSCKKQRAAKKAARSRR